MTDEFEGVIDRRTLLRLSGLAAGGYTLDGVGAQESDQRESADDAEDLPNISGFHPVHVNGMPYGEGGEELPDGAAGEWAEARSETVDLVGAGDAPDVEARLRRKVVGDTLYFGLSVPPEAAEGALSAEEITEIRLDVDRGGPRELTDGDVRLVGQTADSESGGGFVWELRVFEGGEFVETESDGAQPASAAMSDSDDGGVDIEGRINRARLDEALDDESDDDDEFNINTEVGAAGQSWGVNYNPTDIPPAYEIPGYSPTPVGNLKLENSSVMRIEVTQSVQTQTNSLPLVKDKETLARVFVDHPESNPIEVDVQLEGYGFLSGSRFEFSDSPLTESGFQAPPTPLDRENEDHSANFELPDRWRSASRLVLIARVNRPGHYDAGIEDRTAQVDIELTDTYDPTIWMGRVDETSTGGRPPLSAVRAAQSGFTETMPVANPTFVSYDSTRIQNVAPRDDLISRLDMDAFLLKADPTTQTVDHVYGLTQDYAGDTAGLSSPSWANGPNHHRAAWGDDMATNPNGSAPTVMAHEVTHNVGDVDWALHCQADSDFSSGCDMDEVGWSPTFGILPRSTDELMTAEFNPNASDPKLWVGPDRWELLFTRFENFIPGEPRPPGYGGPATTPAPAGTQDSHPDDTSTVRLVSGALLAEGGGYLDPSFEVPGETTEPETDPDEPTAILQVESAESTRTLPFEKSFEPIHDETVEESAFSFLLPDDGTVEAIRLLDAETEEVLDSVEATGFDLDSATVDTPAVFERDEAYEVSVGVEAETETELFRQLLYSPNDGETWLPYSETFTEDSTTVFFSDGPGGESARFMLLLSDGVQTERVESGSFTVPPLPPTVEITGAHRWRVEDGELQDVADPVDTVVGSETTLGASATDQFGDDLTGDAIEWTIETADGESVPVLGSAVGEQFRHTFTRAGTYTVTATATDPETELADDDQITVEVGRPPLPSQEAVEQFLDRESGAVAVVLVPGSKTITPGGTSQFELVVLGATDSLGAYELSVESGAPGAVGLIDYDIAQESALADVELAEDGSVIDFNVAMSEETPDPGDITVATITAEGREEAEVPLELQVEQVGTAEEPIEPYTIAETRGTTVTVSEAVGPPPVSGEEPPTDPDGDGYYEDLDGNGEFDIFDVRTLFNKLDDPVIQDNAQFFNFNGDDEEEVDIFDVRALFNQLE